MTGSLLFPVLESSQQPVSRRARHARLAIDAFVSPQGAWESSDTQSPLLQITAEQIVREAKELQEEEYRAPKQKASAQRLALPSRSPRRPRPSFRPTFALHCTGEARDAPSSAASAPRPHAPPP